MFRPRSFPATAANALIQRRNRGGWLMAIGLAIFAFAPGTASAQTLIDPATLQIGPGQLLSPSTNEGPVGIGNSGFVTVYQNSNGAQDLNTPWQLIIGIPNATSSTSPPIITSYSAGGLTYNTPISESNSALMVSGQEAYSQLGYTGTDSSNSFTNWSGAESNYNSITVSKFKLYEYAIPQTLTANGTDSFQFSNLPQGTFVIAYGETSTKLYDTPFTHAGMTTGPFTATPEPSTLAIGALGALGFIGYGLRRRKK